MLWQFISANGVKSDLWPDSPLTYGDEANTVLVDTKDILAEAIERWIIREEFREEMRKNG